MPLNPGVVAIGGAVFAIGFATTLAMPLFTTYAARDGGGASGLAAAFIAYAATLIVTAPLLGGLSDRIGRRPCVLAALVLAGLSTLALMVAPGLVALGVARMLQGLAIGLVAGGATAWAAELAGGPEAGRQAARVTAFATAGSYGAGALATLAALWLLGDAEPPVTFWGHIAAVVLLVVVVARLPDRRRRPRRRRYPRPRRQLPHQELQGPWRRRCCRHRRHHLRRPSRSLDGRRRRIARRFRSQPSARHSALGSPCCGRAALEVERPASRPRTRA